MDGHFFLLGAGMIGALKQMADNFFGRGEAAVTVPPLDGALKPNRLLDEAAREILPEVDDLALVGGVPVAAAGHALLTRVDAASWQVRSTFPATIAAIAPIREGGLAIALDNGEVRVEGGRWTGRTYRLPAELCCVTAMICDGNGLIIANGSASHTRAHWQKDLLERGASGSIWKLDLESGRCERILGALAYPAGLLLSKGGLVFSEAWKHRLMQIDPSGGGSKPLYTDLPGYPGRLCQAPDGCWLAVFAPRSQLVEFVLREPAYRSRMVAEVPEEFWIAPKLRSGKSFYEPLQGGSVKHLGLLKPWAPTMSAGLCVKLDEAFQPALSLHSRADGQTHGVTAIVADAEQVLVAARGDGVVVVVPRSAMEDN